jgi:predicted transposase YdaD
VPPSSAAIRQEVAGTDQARALADVIAAIVITRFNGRSLKELCAMGGITLDDLSQSVAYQEIFGQGLLEVSTRALPPKRLAAVAAAG